MDGQVVVEVDEQVLAVCLHISDDALVDALSSVGETTLRTIDVEFVTTKVPLQAPGLKVDDVTFGHVSRRTAMRCASA
jgi:hypothetical protein